MKNIFSILLILLFTLNSCDKCKNTTCEAGQNCVKGECKTDENQAIEIDLNVTKKFNPIIGERVEATTSIKTVSRLDLYSSKVVPSIGGPLKLDDFSNNPPVVKGYSSDNYVLQNNNFVYTLVFKDDYTKKTSYRFENYKIEKPVVKSLSKSSTSITVNWKPVKHIDYYQLVCHNYYDTVFMDSKITNTVDSFYTFSPSTSASPGWVSDLPNFETGETYKIILVAIDEDKTSKDNVTFNVDVKAYNNPNDFASDIKW